MAALSSTADWRNKLPSSLYRADQVRELDRLAIEEQGVPGFELMLRAGRFAFRQLLRHWPECRSITVFCGAGNNAGDGYVVAALAAQHQLKVKIYWLSDPEKLTGSARLALEMAASSGIQPEVWDEGTKLEEGLIVDALLGTGVKGQVRNSYAAAIAQINASGFSVFALDIPSGLCSDRGIPLGVAVKANATATFIGLKIGLLTGYGPDYAGNIWFSDLDVPAKIYSKVPAAAERIDFERCQVALRPRGRCAHKGQHGRVLVVGGDLGFGGALIMAAEAACRAGAGLVSAVTQPLHVAALLTRRPEVMAVGAESPGQAETLIEHASVVVVGPGLGQSAWSQRLLQLCLATKLPIVVDADGLNMLVNHFCDQQQRGNWLITPHPGEAARLLGCSVEEINSDRFRAATLLAQKYHAVVILKGAGTVVVNARGEALRVATVGNPGMASGGFGDILSGLLGGLVAQGLNLFEAAQVGVCIHGAAADRLAARQGERGLLAADVLTMVPELLLQAENNVVVEAPNALESLG